MVSQNVQQCHYKKERKLDRKELSHQTKRKWIELIVGLQITLTLEPLFNGWGLTAPMLQSHYKEVVYFLLLSSQKFLILIWSTWKDKKLSQPSSHPVVFRPLLQISSCVRTRPNNAWRTGKEGERSLSEKNQAANENSY